MLSQRRRKFGSIGLDTSFRPAHIGRSTLLRTRVMRSPTVYTLDSTQIDQVALEALQALFDPTDCVSAWYGGHGTFPVGPVIQVAILVGLFVLVAKGIASQRYEVHHVGLSILLYLALFVPVSLQNPFKTTVQTGLGGKNV